MTKEIEITYPCGLKLRFEAGLIKGLKDNETIRCPMHKNRCRGPNKINALKDKMSKSNSILLAN